MADHIVGLDFGSRSIKLIVLDNTGEPVIVDYDKEPLALDHDPYISSSDEASDQAADAEAQDGESNQGESDDDDPRDTPDSEEPTGAAADAESADNWEGSFNPSATWVETLETLLERHDFPNGTQFITFLPEERAISIHEEVPFPEPSKVRSILPNLLEDRLPLNPDQIVYDFELITDESGPEPDHQAVVGLGRKRDIGKFLEQLENSKLNPAVLGIPELMLRYIAEATIPFGETAAVVDIGHQFTRVIVLHDDEPVLARSVEVGGWTATKRIADKLEVTHEQAESYKRNRGTVVPPEQAVDREEKALSDAIRGALKPLVRDLRRNFQSLYAQKRIQLDRIYVCGGTSRLDHLEAYFSDQFGIPIDKLPVDSAIRSQPVDGVGAPETAMALSCALQPVRDRSQDRLLNLRKGEFEYSGHSSYVRSMVTRWGAVAAVLVVLFFGTLFAKKYQLETEAAAMENAVAEQSKKLFGQEITDPAVIDKVVNGESSTDRAFVPEMSAYQLYYELMSRVSSEIELDLERIDVDIDRNIVQMSGTTSDATTVDKVVSDLEQLDCLKDINKKPVTTQNENKVRFQLEISSKCS